LPLPQSRIVRIFNKFTRKWFIRRQIGNHCGRPQVAPTGLLRYLPVVRRRASKAHPYKVAPLICDKLGSATLGLYGVTRSDQLAACTLPGSATLSSTRVYKRASSIMDKKAAISLLKSLEVLNSFLRRAISFFESMLIP
jgi:hypothetical protein